MFEAKIDAAVLRESIESITAVVDEGKLRITEDGFKLRAVDPANVAMVSFDLQRDAFDDFRFEKESDAEAIETGIDFVKLHDILGIGGREGVTLKLDEQAQKLFTTMGSLAYTVSLLDPASLRWRNSEGRYGLRRRSATISCSVWTARSSTWRSRARWTSCDYA